MNTLNGQQAKIDSAAAYRQMLDLWAWKNFETFLDDERQTALELAITSDDLRDVQVNRGKVKAIDAIKSHIGYVLGGE